MESIIKVSVTTSTVHINVHFQDAQILKRKPRLIMYFSQLQNVVIYRKVPAEQTESNP